MQGPCVGVPGSPQWGWLDADALDSRLAVSEASCTPPLAAWVHLWCPGRAMRCSPLGRGPCWTGLALHSGLGPQEPFTAVAPGVLFTTRWGCTTPTPQRLTQVCG